MAKFRKNHTTNFSKSTEKRGSSGSKTTLIRSIFFFIAICILIYILSGVKTDSWDTPNQNSDSGNNVMLSSEKGTSVTANFYPESTTGQVITHKHYVLSYNEEHEQPEWVAYKLTEENLRKPRVKRAKKFKQDDAVTTFSSKHNDYSHSGYTRGHMVPAGDMAFSREAMQESFFMSNISPQVKECNGGIWRELEENVRDWALDNKELYIVSGPILNEGHIIKKIGHNKVSVPNMFYKIILDLKEPEIKSIAFLIPNEKSIQPLKDYTVSIDKIEEITGINFFADFLPPELEEQLEQIGNPEDWDFDKSKFNRRIKNWNNF